MHCTYYVQKVTKCDEQELVQVCHTLQSLPMVIAIANLYSALQERVITKYAQTLNYWITDQIRY